MDIKNNDNLATGKKTACDGDIYREGIIYSSQEIIIESATYGVEHTGPPC